MITCLNITNSDNRTDSGSVTLVWLEFHIKFSLFYNQRWFQGLGFKQDGAKGEFFAIKNRFHVKVIPELDQEVQRSHRVSRKIITSNFYTVVKGRLYFLLHQPTHKRIKIDELKEITASFKQSNIENVELYTEIQILKGKLNEFKTINIENMKYREASNRRSIKWRYEPKDAFLNRFSSSSTVLSKSCIEYN